MSLLPYPIREGLSQISTVLWLLSAALPILGLALKRSTRSNPHSKAERTSDIFEALNAFPFIVVIEDADYNVCFMNVKAREKFGDRTGEKCHRAFVGHENPCVVCPVREILHDGKECFSYFPQYKDGFMYESSSRPFTMPDGTRVIIKILRDIAEKKKADRVVHDFTEALKQLVSEKTDELRRSEERYRNLVDNASDAILTIDPAEDRILSANHMAETITGYAIEELIGSRHSRICPSDEFARVLCELSDAPAGSRITTTIEMLRKDGSRVPVDVSATHVVHDGRRVVLTICRDISWRLTLEKRMRELACAVETMRPSVIITDLRHKIAYVNPAAEKMLGYRKEEMLGRRAIEIFEGIPGNPTNLGVTVREEAQNGYWEAEIFNRKKSGEIIPIFLRMSTIRNENGETLGYVGISEDITQRKRMEEELIQKEKLSALGEFISAIAHEINNPLTGVLGYAELLQHAENPKDFKDDLQRLYKEAVRCQCLVKNLLTFARRSTPHKESSDVNEIVERSIELKRHQLKTDGVEVAINLDSGIPPAMLDPHQIQQVFLNIIDNAYHALREQGGPRLMGVTSVLKSGNVEISFRNNGPAIPQNVLGKIFAPFFTTKDFGKGTGLGLSIAHGIIRDHGGKISVQSEEGKDTVFTISIPFNPNHLSNSPPIV
ncbi:MAG: PAS domain S-box protein [bacterium]